MTTEPEREVGLVSCVKSKRDAPAMPAELYTSPYFEKMQTYVEREHDDWRILSAKHGVLNPYGEPIKPYDDTLSGAPVARRREWADRIATELDRAGFLTADTCLVLHAGKAYSEELVPLLRESAVKDIKTPLDGLQIGKRLSWYNERL